MKKTKTICISDLHFGNKNNSKKHSNDLLEFAEFIVDHSNGIGRLNVLGDVYHQRDKLDIDVVNSSIEFFKYLSNYFDISMIVGNHDMYYQDRRNINSLNILSQYVDLIIDHKKVGNDLLTSWIISDEEYDELVRRTKKDKIKNIYGHFEFSTFKMNDHYVMEHGQTHKSLSHVNKIYTGHYHKRQEKDNVIYIGTPFPFDYNDSNDSERGFIITDDENYEFVNYNKIKVLTVTHKEFLDRSFENTEDTSIRIVIDESIDETTIDTLKEKLNESEFRDSRLQYKLDKTSQLTNDNQDIDVSEIKDTDSIVLMLLDEMEDGDFNKELLKSIYKKSKGE